MKDIIESNSKKNILLLNFFAKTSEQKTTRKGLLTLENIQRLWQHTPSERSSQQYPSLLWQQIQLF